jgi:hypothetical protein
MRFVGQYARFENLEDSQYGDDFNPSSMSNGMQRNSSFDTPMTTTIRSSMNDSDIGIDFDEHSDAPF